jgi:hypothetical protein
MPYITRPRLVQRIVAALFSTALLVGAVPAVATAASVPCPSSPTTAALAQYGDNAAYTLLPGSSFEAGAPGWSLSNAAVESGAGANGASHWLAIRPNGVAVSPAFCVSSEYPSFRFFARQISGGGWGSSLNVSLRWTDVYGFSHNTGVPALQPSSSWALSPVLELASALPLWMPGSTLKVQLVFQASYAAGWAISGVYIDPYKR